MNIDKLKIVAVIPAAGIGERCGQKVPKQFSVVCHRPLIYHTIEAFLRIKWINQILIVCPIRYQEEINDIAVKLDSHDSKLICIPGDSTRHRSIAAGIKAIKEEVKFIPDIVVIHDGARPIVDEVILQKIILAAFKHGAAGPICKLSSTVVCVDQNGFLDHALDREKYRASEMPQAFKYDLIKEAYEKCTDHDYDYNTECLDLVQRYASSKVKLIEGTSENLFKVTYSKDLYTADGKLKEKQNVLYQICSNKSAPKCVSLSLYENLKIKLHENFKNVSFSRSANDSLIFRIHIQLCFCCSWAELEKFVINNFNETLIYIAICITEETLPSDCYSEFLSWSKRNQIIDRFYIIHSNLQDVRKSNKVLDRIVKTTVFLAKHGPLELSGQTFFY